MSLLQSRIPTYGSPESPQRSLQSGCWFKLICGASYQALPDVRNLTLAYALAGADCVDVAADPSVIAAAKAGLQAAEKYAIERELAFNRPWLMASISAGEDPHFRKAWFDAAICPSDCLRPCERVCPADAIAPASSEIGVIRDRCYGCGRCLPICPYGLIEAQSHPTKVREVAQQVLPQVDALEIHTHVGQLAEFSQLWQTIEPQAKGLKLVSVSCPDGADYVEYLRSLQDMIQTSVRTKACRQDLLVMWQTDGRPMSGDIGRGTTHAAIELARKVLSSGLEGYIQLAGGTNQYTVSKLDALGLLNHRPASCPPENLTESLRGERLKDEIASRSSRSTSKRLGRPFVSGIAYGSFARSLLAHTIEQTPYLEEDPQQLQAALNLAKSLVDPLKRFTLLR